VVGVVGEFFVGSAFVVDASGAVYVTGVPDIDFPSLNAFDSTANWTPESKHRNRRDAFVAKLAE